MIKHFLSISVCHKNASQDINIFHFSNKYCVQNLTWYKQTRLFTGLLPELVQPHLQKQRLGANSSLDRSCKARVQSLAFRKDHRDSARPKELGTSALNTPGDDNTLSLGKYAIFLYTLHYWKQNMPLSFLFFFWSFLMTCRSPYTFWTINSYPLPMLQTLSPSPSSLWCLLHLFITFKTF